MGGGNFIHESLFMIKIVIPLVVPIFQFHLSLPVFDAGFHTRIFGPPPVTMVALNRVAIARGLRDVDELLGCLGKQVHEVSTKEAIQLLREECSPEEFQDVGLTYLYGPGKGYRPCNDLLKEYLKGIKESDSPGLTRVRLKELKKYCGYTDDELSSLM
ncbi:uncharacterized protein LOC141597061 isoform X1 [Silene latifolia]|uniref:uncharacterized protein LOC141597061 isoform X1 n=1 Tax=Silene latifolia TaxID=37657 RepID=UPI003D7741BF